MKKAMCFLLFCGTILWQASPLHGQSPMEQAIAASFPLTKATADETDIVTAGAVMTLKKDHVIMFATTASTKASLNYKDGKLSPSVQTRLAAFNIMGRPATNIVQRTYVAGEKLWLIGLQAAGDSVTLQFLSDPVGDTRYATSIKFPFPKGTTPTSQQMIAEIGEVIAPDGGVAPGPPAPAAAPAEAPIVAPPPPGGSTAVMQRGAAGKPPEWQIRPIESGREAFLQGTLRTNGKPSPILLGFGCTSQDVPAMPGKPLITMKTELRLRQAALAVPKENFQDCEGEGDWNTDVQLTLGQNPEEAAYACTTLTGDEKAPLFILAFDPGLSTLRQMLAVPDAPLRFRVTTTEQKAEMSADFQLPLDSSQVVSLMAPCFKGGDMLSASIAQNDQWKLRCPVVPGLGVRSMDVLSANGKPYVSARDPEDDGTSGTQWSFPKATKAHPVRAKFTLSCSYGPGEKKTDKSEILEKKLVPIPVTVHYCRFDGLAELGNVIAGCS